MVAIGFVRGKNAPRINNTRATKGHRTHKLHTRVCINTYPKPPKDIAGVAAPPVAGAAGAPKPGNEKPATKKNYKYNNKIETFIKPIKERNNENSKWISD